MSDAADTNTSAGAFARIVPATVAALVLCFALVHVLLPAADWTDTPSLLDSAVESLCAALLTAAIVAGVRLRQMAWQSLRTRIALDNMSQGLCMFDSDERLLVCNQRYRAMYGLSEQVVSVGITLAELLQARIAAGSFARNIDEYRRELLSSLADGKTKSVEVTTADGRTILVVNRPMPGGGWVATHEDVTERRKAERERIGMQQQQAQRDAIEQAIQGFRRRVEDLLHTVADGAMAMRSTAGVLLESSGRTAQCAESALSASNDASSNVQTAAAAADELTSSISEIGRQLNLTTGIVGAAADEAKDTNAQITALAQAAQKIGDVIKLIRAIAGQTNLLALNATIEAARAGEAGKGFAVVAAEVKSLAVQTAKATEDISTLITSVQGATEGAVDAIGRIAGRMQEIDSCATAVSASVSQQSSATSEISQNVTGAADGAKLVVSVLDEVTEAAGDTRRSAENMLAASQEVEVAAAALRGEVEGFLKRVAAQQPPVRARCRTN